MRIGIDASNLKRGGGLTHLSALLTHADPLDAGLERVVVWGSRAALERLPERPWLIKASCAELEGSVGAQLSWRRRTLPALARRECDLLFAPGGLCTDRIHPVVTMSRNMLPFQWREAFRYGPSAMLVRLALLRRLQQRSFRTADGVIFLSQFAQDTVLRTTGPLPGGTTVIPHGVAGPFFKAPRPQRSLTDYSADRPMRILYVSIIDVYKHQWHVAEAVARLRREGMPIAVEFVGASYPKAASRLSRTLHQLDPGQGFLTMSGPVNHAALPDRYHSADAFIFASSCENLPNILLEAMAAGLPIASSQSGPMPGVLGESGLYFDPLKPESITKTLRRLVEDADLRGRLATGAYLRAGQFSWEQCAQLTFRFLAAVFENARNPMGCLTSSTTSEARCPNRESPTPACVAGHRGSDHQK
jgi:glycosyltransferase involved in cell wall biosynthesis